MAYASGFVARGDLVMVGTFLVLWGKVAAVQGGMDTAAAIDAGRIPFIVAQSAALLWAICAVFLLDRFHRVTGLAICMGLAATGYLGVLFVGDPLARESMPFFVLLGIGQISAFLGATTLIGKEAPVAERGSVVGFFSVAGALGILVTSGIGGVLFDSIDPRAPFVLLGLLNMAVVVAAIAVRIRTQSLDGKISKSKNKQTWLTGKEAIKFVHKLRSEYDAVLVGANTIKVDNPLLTVREVKGRNPIRIIIDGKLSIPLNSKILNNNEPNKTWIFTSQKSKQKKLIQLENKGAKIFSVKPAANSRINLKSVLKVIAKNRINSVLVEGGNTGNLLPIF